MNITHPVERAPERALIPEVPLVEKALRRARTSIPVSVPKKDSSPGAWRLPVHGVRQKNVTFRVSSVFIWCECNKIGSK